MAPRRKGMARLCKLFGVATHKEVMEFFQKKQENYELIHHYTEITKKIKKGCRRGRWFETECVPKSTIFI